MLFSEITKAWLLYLGLTFLLMVMYAPGGIASLIDANWRVIRHGLMRPLLSVYAVLLAAVLLMLFGACSMIEMVYHLQLQLIPDGTLVFLGMRLQALEPATWLMCVAALLVGGLILCPTQQRFAERWNAVQTEIAQREAQGGAA